MNNLNSLRIASINVHCLRDPTNRHAVFDSLSNLSEDIVYLQETYGTDLDTDSWGREWGGQNCFNIFTTREASVAILFHSSLDIEIKQTKSSPSKSRN